MRVKAWTAAVLLALWGVSLQGVSAQESRPEAAPQEAAPPEEAADTQPSGAEETPGGAETAPGAEGTPAEAGSAARPPRTSMIQTDRPQLELSLAEAVQLTVSKSIITRVREVDRVQALALVESSKAGYDPLLRTSVTGSGNQTSTTSSLESTSGQLVENDATLATSVSQALPVGGTVQVQWQTSRGETNRPFSLLKTDYFSSLGATLSYPLLRNRGNLTLETQIDQAKNSLELAELGLRQQVIDAVAQTQDDYLDLILARENLKLQIQSLELAQNQLEIAQAQERVGTLAPIEVLSAEAAVAAREEGIIVAESAVLAAEDVLRTSLNLPESLRMWDVAIVPTDEPGFPEQQFDFATAVARAFELRPDYQQAKVNLRTQRLEVELSRNQARPQLDLTGSFGFVGTSQVGIGVDPDTGEAIGVPQGGIFGSHVENLLSFDNFRWSLGFSVSQPLGNRVALGSYRVDKLELEKSLLQLRNLELTIVSQVRRLLRSIETNRKRVAAARVATELARKRLEAEEKKFQVGTSTSFDVLQFQERYVAQATTQTQAIIDLNRSVLALQQALGLTLEANGIRIEDGRPVIGAEAPAANP